MNLQPKLFFLVCVLALVLLSPGSLSASTPELGFASVPVASVWTWINNILGDQQRMIQIGAVVVVIAIFVLVRK